MLSCCMPVPARLPPPPPPAHCPPRCRLPSPPQHRYYGESLPLGNTSLTNAGLQWLTTEQVLADYAELAQAVRVVSQAGARTHWN